MEWGGIMDKRTAIYYKNANLSQITQEDYIYLIDTGMLYVYFPEATGIQKYDIPHTMTSRIDTIGQNGNDGEHYNEGEFRLPMSDGVTVSDKWPHVKGTFDSLAKHADEMNYRVSGDDNPDGVNINLGEDTDDLVWPHRYEAGYAEKIERLYDLPKDGMFVDDYEEQDNEAGRYMENMINQPNHYRLNIITEEGNLLQVIDVIDAVLSSEEAIDWLNPYEGGQYTGVIERILRAPKKDQLQDLKKAHKQLGWLIQSLEE